MKRYRVNPKNFPKFKRGFRSGEYYLEKPCLGCQPNSFAIHRENKEKFYPSKELLNKYKKYLPKLTPIQIEVGFTEENRDSVEIIFWECRNCGTKTPQKYINWDYSKGITGNHYKLFELIEDLDEVSNIDFKEEWHLKAFNNKNFIDINEQYY